MRTENRRWGAQAIFAALVLVTVARSAVAHEHMYIGSTVSGGGSLVLRYDFARRFPLEPLPGSPGTYLGIDPAFNAQIFDDPANGIYRLPDGVRVTMQVTALDPGVTVNFNGTILKKAGNKAVVGTMPYLHQHPEWTLTVPEGVFGEYHLSFKVTASGFGASPVYTATLTNVAPPTTSTTSTSSSTTSVSTSTVTSTSSSSSSSTLPGEGTTTTLPGATTSTAPAASTTTSTTASPSTTVTTSSTTSTTVAGCAAACDDGDGCTIDACETDGTCRHDPRSGKDAVTCRLDGIAALLGSIEPATPAATRTVQRLSTTIETVRRLVDGGMVGGRKGARLFRRAESALARFEKALVPAVKRKRITAEVADALETLAADGREQVQLLAAAMP